MIYQDPLAYLIGIEGRALLEAWAGEYDRAFVEARLAEVRRLLDDEQLRDRGVDVEVVDAATAYAQESAGYDAGGGGGLFAMDAPVVAEFLDGREPGVALDAACGTGRFAEYLAGRGHKVIGVDASPDMLAIARERVPGGEFHVGDLGRLPLPDSSVDVVVCALAFTHVPRVEPALAEFARVLRPGGDLVISDLHPELTAIGSGIKGLGPAGEPRHAPNYRHRLADYLTPALRLGLQVKRYEEPTNYWGPRDRPLPEPATEIGDWPGWPWSLIAYVPAATRAATDGRPSLAVWHFHRPATSS